MNEQVVIDIVSDALMLILKASAPMLLSGLIIGVIVSIFQAVTSIQEQTLAFVPKIVAIFLSLLLCGSWILTILTEFTSTLWTDLARFIR